MPIKAKKATKRELCPEKDFPDLFVSQLQISASPDAGNLYVQLTAYDEATKELHTDHREEITVRNFWECIAEVPEAATALGAVLAAVQPIMDWQEAKQAQPEPQ